MGKELLKRFFNFILVAIALFAFFMAIAMLFISNVNNFWSFLVVFISGLMLLPPIQSSLNTIIGKKIHPIIYVFIAVVVFFAGIIIGAGTTEQVEKKKAEEDAKARIEKAEKQRKAKERAAEIQAKKERNRIEAKEKAEREEEKQRKYNTSKTVLITNCELAVKPTLKNPRSMSVDFSQTKVGNLNDGLGVNLYYYAENSFGASVINMAQCAFNKDGVLLSFEHVQ